MNSTGKVVIGIIVLLIVAAAGYYWYKSTDTNGTPSMGTALQVPAPTGNLPTGSNGSAGNTTAKPNTSDTGLAQDATAIDAQMNGLTADTANVNSTVTGNP
jgi:hypothetical protein